MQKTLTPQHLSKNDCFPDDAVEDAEEIDTPLSSISTSGQLFRNLRFAHDIDLQVGTEENSNNSLKDLRLAKISSSKNWPANRKSDKVCHGAAR